MFSAVGADSTGALVHGLRFNWNVEDASDTKGVQIDEAGRAAFLQFGLYRITARAGSVEGTATVLVKPNRRPRQSDEQWNTDQKSLQASTTGSVEMEGLPSSVFEKLLPTVHAQGGSSSDIGLSAAVGVVGSPRAISLTMVLIAMFTMLRIGWRLQILKRPRAHTTNGVIA